MVKRIIAYSIVILFSFVASYSLFHKGLFPTHDGEYHVIRFFEFAKVFWDGDWYPRWAPDLNYGFGVPLFNYVYPLPNYLSVIFSFLGISFIDAFKLNLFFATITGGIFFYLWSREFWGEAGAIASAVFYLFSPYRLVDVFIRGSVGETWALAFFPACLWAVTVFVRDKKLWFGIFTSVFLSFVIFSHNILALMFFLFLISYIVFIYFWYNLPRKKIHLFSICFFLLLGLGLSAIFWLPALFETKFVTGLRIYNIEENFPELFQLLIPSWGSGFSGQNLSNQMSFQIGVANLVGILLSVVSFLIKTKDKAKNKKITAFFLFWFVFVFFLMLRQSSFIWETFSFMSYFQFPWRFLSIEIVIASFLLGSFINIFSGAKKWVLSFALVGFAVLLGIDYTKPAYYHLRDDSYYLTRSNFIDGTNSPGDFFNTIWWENGPKQRADRKLKFLDGTGKILLKDIKSTDYLFTVETDKKSRLLLATAYFPGWKVFVDKENVTVYPTGDGLMSFDVSKGEHEIRVKFVDTTIRMIAKYIFFLSIIIVLSLFVAGGKTYDRLAVVDQKTKI